MGKNIIIVIAILLVVVGFWIGGSIYYSVSSIDVDPAANTYILPIPASFDKTALTAVDSRVKTLPITPEEFTK